MDRSGLFAAAISRELAGRFSGYQLDEGVFTICCDGQDEEYNCSPEEVACGAICFMEIIMAGIKYLL